MIEDTRDRNNDSSYLFGSMLRIKIRSFAELARPRHAIKNMIVFLPWAMTGFTDSFVGPIIAFVVFCLFSVAVYSINDTLDAFYDVSHPTKCHRPVASGLLSETEAFLFAAVCLSVALLVSALMLPIGILFGIVYLVINVFYSSIGKEIAIVDVISVSSGFALRFAMGSSAIEGSAAIDWMIGPLFLAATGLAIGKRFAKMALSTRISESRIPKMYTNDNLSGMLFLITHLSVLFGGWLIFSDNGSFRNAIGLSSISLYLISICAVTILARIVFLIIRKSIEPAMAFTHDYLTLIGSTILAAIFVIDKLT